ncbi:MAG TPA: amidohydrolase family protein [Allosphingosinicella sp.]|nr:amidohydrolase family protein [Allosphingosinicella sp.]
MRSILLTLLAAFALLSGAPAAAQAARAVYAITDVTVVPMDRERLLPGRTVIVRDGRIAAIGAARSTRIPAGAVRIDGRNRYLMPGLAEMHAHVPAGADAQWTRDVLFLYAANGITFARGMLGAPAHLELRSKLEQGALIGPRLYTSGPSLNGNSVATPEDGRRMVAEQKAAGYDFLKIHPGLDRARYDAIAAAARAHKLPFGGHVPDAVGLRRALEAGQATVDHLDGYMPLLVRDDFAIPEGAGGFFGYDLADSVDERKIAQAARLTRQAAVWNVPTDSLMHHMLLPGLGEAELLAREELRYVPSAMLEGWKQARAGFRAQPDYVPARAARFILVRGKLIKALHDSGAGLLLGSDAPQLFNVPGFSLHRELTYFVQAGLTPYQALSAGTREVARFLGTPGDFGTVEPGRRADLILIEGDPLKDVANVRRRAGVMVGGRWLGRDEIEAGLAAIAARHAG